MPHSNYQEHLAAMRAYAATPAGKAAKQRSHANYVKRRREAATSSWKPNAAPLIQAINNWKK